ncbi:MAG: hypothetical protein U9R06_00875 [Patescibacteria group bacterium]|nr:hypothetical protein [Patescibacteria group bacterium]
MKWINFLHIYQPVNIEEWIIREAADKSYARIFQALDKNPQIKFTFNIAGCLLLRLDEMGYGGLIKLISKLYNRGQIELTGTPAYHPLMPLIPKEENVRQILENKKIHRKYFGSEYKARGFFLPEMAYSAEAARIVKKLGYEWIILDEISLTGRIGEVNFGKVYKDMNSGLKVVFREKKLSNSYIPKILMSKARKGNERLRITATDGELYGLRHEDSEKIFEKFIKLENLQTLTLSEFIDSAQNGKEARIVDSHWNSTEEDIKKGVSFSLWRDKGNKLQEKLWVLADKAYEAVETNKGDKNYEWARWHLARGLASCSFWWASAKDFRVFGPISWSPNEIERGVNELMRAVRSLEKRNTKKIKLETEKLSADIKLRAWTKHWEKYWGK